MHKAGQRNLRGPYSTSGRGLSLQHADGAPGLGEAYGGSESVGSGADNDGISAGQLRVCFEIGCIVRHKQQGVISMA